MLPMKSYQGNLTFLKFAPSLAPGISVSLLKILEFREAVERAWGFSIQALTSSYLSSCPDSSLYSCMILASYLIFMPQFLHF